MIFNEKPIGFSGIQPLIRRKLQREELPVIVEADRSADAGDLMRVIDEQDRRHGRRQADLKVSVATRKGGGA